MSTRNIYVNCMYIENLTMSSVEKIKKSFESRGIKYKVSWDMIFTFETRRIVPEKFYKEISGIYKDSTVFFSSSSTLAPNVSENYILVNGDIVSHQNKLLPASDKK